MHVFPSFPFYTKQKKLAVTAQFSSTNLKEECSSMNLAQNHSINSLKTTEKKTSGSLGYWTSTTDMGTQSYSFTVYAL